MKKNLSITIGQVNRINHQIIKKIQNHKKLPIQMIPKNYQQKILRHRLLIFILTTVFFLCAFVLNIVMNTPLYNTNLNIVPKIQTSAGWGSDGFLVFMNIVSNVFNPIICAGYIILFFVISYRKLEILVFLIWFIFLSWILSLMKMIFHQARPYWIGDASVKMLEWTCYTEYGMPSGHSMMAIILLEFVVRFYARVNKFVAKYIGVFYFFIILFEICVMFSRVILGMHSFNQVLLGCLIGCYTFVPYYLFVQRFILRWVLSIFKSQKSMITAVVLLCISCTSWCIEVLLALAITYKNTDYINVINSIKGCDGYLLYKSFQYKCLEDSALLMAAVGILMAFNLMKNPSHLNLQLNYTRISCKYVGKVVVTILFPVLILLIFVNPLWDKIDLDSDAKSLVIWSCQTVGFFLSTFTLIYIIPIVNHKFGFEVYRIPDSYQDFKRFEVINMLSSISFVVQKTLSQKRRQTQLIENAASHASSEKETTKINQSIKQEQNRNQ